MARRRTRARQLALQFLYLYDQRGEEVLPERDALFDAETDDPEVLATAKDLVTGTIRHRTELDAEIRAVAENWDIDRMAIVDRNILRLSCYEILHRADIPAKVSINEGVELAKTFSTENSGAFVNGILDQIVRRHPKPGS
ncbi:MAG: transcription antitermination factor NusB [Planctomycetes bacterium]|nr:transcription antitermination factor NusB [Planctomycetota bacterium]